MQEQIVIRQAVTGMGRDLLLQGDGSLETPVLQERAGTVQAVYIDPPFMSGGVYPRKRRFGEKGWKTGSPSPSFPGYDDRYPSREAWMAMVRGMLTNARMLLKEDGAVLLHLDWHASHLGRLLCEEVFGEHCFMNEIVWAYESGGRAVNHFSRKHDTILMFSRGKKARFDITRVPIGRREAQDNHLRRAVDEDGRPYRSVKVGGKEYRYYDDEPVYPSDVWDDVSHIQQRSPERTGFATQKPLQLLDRLLKPLVLPGDTVADLCCGSGTALAAAEALGCHYIGMDMSPEALLITRSRLKADDLTLMLESSDDLAPLQVQTDPASGTMILTGFGAQHPCFPKDPKPLEALERWGVGELKNGVLHEQTVCQRSTAQPRLNCVCQPEQPLTCPVISTVDAAGVYRVYQLKEGNDQ